MSDFFTIPDTDLSLCPLGLGTAGAGLDWDGADADYLFDAYLDMGGNLIDTARIYSDWVAPETGRSERVIGDWIQRSGRRVWNCCRQQKIRWKMTYPASLPCQTHLQHGR